MGRLLERPRATVVWMLMPPAMLSAGLAAAFAAYQLLPGEDPAVSEELASLPLVVPWTILLLAVTEAVLAWFAIRAGARLPALLFTMAAAVTAATSLWPLFALGLYAYRENVSLSLSVPEPGAATIWVASGAPLGGTSAATAPRQDAA